MSLKHKYADEIAAAMVKSLEDKAFMGQFTKEAGASHEASLREAIVRGDKAECVKLMNTYFGGGEGDTALQAELRTRHGSDDKAIEVTSELRRALSAVCESGIGTAVPPMAADDECEKCHGKECKCDKEKEEDCQDCGDNGLDPNTEIALAFAMDHLVKVADALDGRGFAGVAEIVDEAVEKLASKKK